MLLKLLTLGGLGYAGYKYYEHQKANGNPAFAGTYGRSDHRTVRDAGPESMRDTPTRGWSKTDEELDETFPASDPPGNY